VDGRPRANSADALGVYDARPPSDAQDSDVFARLLLANLPQIDRVVAFIGRRHGLDAAERDELGSVVRLKLIEGDYEILRKFEGRSRFETYLTTVVQRIFLDERVKRWGKWRPSTEAMRLGPLAVRFETLLWRDGIGREEACRALESSGPATREELDVLFAKLPPRIPRREVGEGVMAGLADAGADAEVALRGREARDAAHKAQDALTAAFGDLSGEDRLILKMRFEDSFAIADIAVALRLEARPLYRRIDVILMGLRRRLESAGLDASVIANLVATRDADIQFSFTAREIPAPSPSKKEM
jgi:DNA-directed RNA polymerase specialized sigma24 family protein